MLFCLSIKMWRMAIFIRHKCGEHKHTVGHCCSRVSTPNTGKPSISSTFHARIFHFSYKIFGAKISNPKASFVQNFVAKNALLYEKPVHKMLMKLTNGVWVLRYIIFKIKKIKIVIRLDRKFKYNTFIVFLYWYKKP